MKKVLAGVLALVAVLALGTLADAAKQKPKKFTSKVGVSYSPGVDDPYDPYDQAYSKAKFDGKVKVKAKGPNKAKVKKACLKGRTVKIRGIGRDRTNRRGRYSISGGSANAPDGNYRAVVKKKQKGKRIVCKRARSGRITVS